MKNIPHLNKKAVGFLGEKIAQKLLIKKGYKILETNWGNKWGEIDIICTLNNLTEPYIFVEVKTKIECNFGSPENMITPKKLKQIAKISSIYSPAINKCKRIDVISVVLSNEYKIIRLTHYTSVY